MAAHYRLRLIMIGASTMVLALILFSGTCWFACSTLLAGIVAEVGFWELFGVSSAGAAGLLLLRPVRRRLLPRLSGGRPPDAHHGLSSPTAPPSLPSDESTPRWKQMYDQLSQEERRLMREMLARAADLRQRRTRPDAPEMSGPPEEERGSTGSSTA